MVSRLVQCPQLVRDESQALLSGQKSLIRTITNKPFNSQEAAVDVTETWKVLVVLPEIPEKQFLISLNRSMRTG